MRGQFGLAILATVTAVLGLIFVRIWNLQAGTMRLQSLVALALIVYAFGMWLLRSEDSLRVGLISTIVLVALLGLATSVINSRVDSLATGFFYVWLAAYLSFAMERKPGLAVVGLSSISYLAGILLSGVRTPLAAWLLVTVTMISIYFEVSRLQQNTSQMVVTDHLTGVMNRRGFIAIVDKELARLQRGGTGFTLAIVDLDNFKSLNDTKGHQAGDELLVEVTSRWKGLIRGTDHLFRLGGDEFVFLFDAAEETQAVALVDRIMLETPWSFSAGITSAMSSDDSSSVLRRADQGLYESKRNGGGRSTLKSI